MGILDKVEKKLNVEPINGEIIEKNRPYMILEHHLKQAENHLKSLSDKYLVNQT